MPMGVISTTEVTDLVRLGKSRLGLTHIIERPIRCSTQSRTFSTHGERVDLCGI